MEDWPYRQVALQFLERLFDSNELHVVLPQQRGIVLREVGAQQIASFALPDPPQLEAVEGVDEHGAFLVHLDIDQAPCGGSAGPCRTQLHQHLLARNFHRGQLSQPLPQPLQLPPAHRTFLADTRGTFSEHVEFAVLVQQLDRDTRAGFLPGLGEELFLNTP